jgi:Zn-finger nucleic acid-binding protein
MKCPIDPTVDLLMTERQGVEIDYCPACRGVWLDRGELDKLIERSTGDDRDERYRDREDRRPAVPHKKKKSSFLGDLFDF